MPRPRNKDAKSGNGKGPETIGSTQSLSAFVKGVCDIMRRSNCASALQYVPELTWILFLRILDAQESREREAAQVQGRDFSPALRAPFRWKDWAAPCEEKNPACTPEGESFGWKAMS
jgi:type I restriction enzyme M protein